jgi:hypothetical protein
VNVLPEESVQDEDPRAGGWLLEVGARRCRDRGGVGGRVADASLPSAAEPRGGTLTRGHVGKRELRGQEMREYRVWSIEYGGTPAARWP